VQRRIPPCAFGVGALAYLLKNRFYIGEVVYRGEVHRGDHAPILDRPLFEAVQAKLAVQTVARRCRLRGSSALLTGRLFDDRGHRMSPSHTNKGGVRYRYYVSQALLQSKVQGAGSIGRVPAAEIEALVLAALRHHLQASGAEPQPTADTDRERGMAAVSTLEGTTTFRRARSLMSDTRQLRSLEAVDFLLAAFMSRPCRRKVCHCGKYPLRARTGVISHRHEHPREKG
jgi:hypothetical protein